MHAIPHRVVETLREAEAELKSLIIEATNNDQYDDVAAISGVSAKLRDLISTIDVPVVRERRSGTHVYSDRRSTEVEGPQRRASSVVERPSYPAFRIEEDQLVKVGWSTANSQEYEHRVPRHGVDAFVNHIASLKRSRFPVTSEAIAKSLQKDDDAPIMGYQVYVVAAWLRSEELILTNGRQGYSLPEGVDLRSAVDVAWSRLSNPLTSQSESR